MTDSVLKILDNETKEWREWNGQLHREDGPAVELYGGTVMWVKHGKLHREDGPAIEWDDGSKEWWFDDVRLDPIEHFIKVQAMLN